MLKSRTKAISIEQTPLFRPSGNPLAGLVITIDPGHGGHSHASGYAGSARGVKSLVSEEHLNLLVAGQLRQYLQEAGAKVCLTHTGDEKVVPGASSRDQELGARTQKAIDTASHLFLSFHHNWSDRPSAHGVFLLIRPEPSSIELAFADILREEIEKQVPHAERFDHWKHEHPLVTGSPVPSAVVEFGFLSNESFDEWVSQIGTHKAEALGAYNAILRMWQEHRTELEDTRARLFPSAPPVSFAPVSVPYLSTLAKQVWPLESVPTSEAEVNWIIETYKARALNDRTLFWMDVQVSKSDSSWVLSGSVNYSHIRSGCELLLSALSVEPIDNQIRLLPDTTKLGDKVFGICKIPLAMTWGEPCEGVEVQSQLLLGERLHLLDVSDDGLFLLAQGQDGYVGWVSSDAVLRLNLTELGAWAHAERAVIVQEMMVDDLRLPMGACLPILGFEGDGAALRLPRGFRATDDLNEVMVEAEAIMELPRNAEPGRMAVQNAMSLMTTPYVFGGRSSLGTDCSGMTGLSYQALGDCLSRDARQQIVAGQLVGTSWHIQDLKPGDLLYFTDLLGRVTHTGMSIGGYRYIHSSYPEVQISSLDPADELYIETNAKRFCFAKRPYLD